jgi:type IV pilus modification protein PilV
VSERSTEPPARLRNREGFSLIEVLVAMVILAIGLLALESMAIGAARHVAAANRTTEYTHVATQQMESVLERLRADPNFNAQSSRAELDNGTVVETVVQTTANPAGVVWDVDVTVTPPHRADLNLRPVTIRGSYFR